MTARVPCVVLHVRFYRRYLELRAKINAGTSCPTLHTPRTPTRSASLKEKCFPR
ncbi:hypothetical protein J6590_014300 [Homalodisca vitripennis]|nr:hypothetical protein J6590_014300 [Homalodisca vitripennis]